MERFKPRATTNNEPEPERVKPPKPPKQSGAYLKKAPLQFLSSGCTLLDCILGGGWPLGRCSNIVGDKSTGKTLLAIEAAANFNTMFPKGSIWYREAEGAFDIPYAETLGLPTDRVDFGKQGIETPWDTIEDVIEDIGAKLAKIEASETGLPPGGAGLYIVDSLDALTSRAEVERELKRKPGVGTYNLEKPKAVAELFRKYVRRLKKANILLLIISQVRDRIGLGFGEKYTRSGGKALDFYASQALWLSHLGTETKQIGGVKRAVSILVRARCKKNKVGPPLRECEFFIRFGYGVDDLEANIEWLSAVGRLGQVQAGLNKEKLPKFFTDTEKLSQSAYRARCREIQEIVRMAWSEVEQDFLPRHTKYGPVEADV